MFTLFHVSLAAAQPVPAAQALYERGVSNFKAGRYELACQELAESYRLEALPGALFTLATCEARAGRAASSAAHYADFLQLVSRLPVEQRALQRERVQVATAERNALLPHIPYLTVQLDRPLPAQAVVRCDGAVLGVSALGRKLPLDPGMHVLSVTLADGARSEQRILLERGRHVVTQLELPRPAAPVQADVNRDAPSRRGQVLVYTSAVLGLTALGTGIVTGALAWKKKASIDANCEESRCNARGKSAADKAQRQALVSTIGFAVGITGLATALVLHLANKRANSSPVKVSLFSDRVIVGAAF